jgi:two-component system response regulator AlgR
MKVLVVDDEAPARARLRQIVDELDGYRCVGEAASGDEALAMAADTNPDIVLLDIRMPGLDGIQTAHHLNRLDTPPAVVFATAYDEYAIDAFEAEAVGYVLKPVRRARLEAALGRASRLAPAALSGVAAADGIESERRHVSVNEHGRLTLIPIEDIAVFRADQKYVTVEHAGGESLIDESLKSLEETFGDRFVRIHRSALVAVDRIAALEKTGDGKTRVVVRDRSHPDAEALIISRRHLADVRRRLKRP